MEIIGSFNIGKGWDKVSEVGIGKGFESGFTKEGLGSSIIFQGENGVGNFRCDANVDKDVGKVRVW